MPSIYLIPPSPYTPEAARNAPRAGSARGASQGRVIGGKGSWADFGQGSMGNSGLTCRPRSRYNSDGFLGPGGNHAIHRHFGRYLSRHSRAGGLAMRNRLLCGFVLFLIVITTVLIVASVAQEQHRAPILIPGVQEPDEMRVEPFPIIVPTEPVKMLAEATQKFGKTEPATMLPALNRVLAKFPDFSDGYAMRATLSFCESGDMATALSDIDNALKHAGNSLVKELAGSLLSMRAKIEYAKGDYVAAMDDLDKAIRADLTKATGFANSGAVKPEKTASACVWTEPDMNALVQRFPSDYRSYLFRGLYFGFFARFDEGSLKPAIENLNKAIEIDARSALPHLFKALVLRDAFFFKRLNMSEASRADLYKDQPTQLTAALSIDPKLLDALRERAEAYFNLKQFEKAITDYDTILSLDPKDATIYNDRGLAKMQLGRDYDAISDLGEAIKIKSRQLQHRKSFESQADAHSYDNRADAYMKTRQWDLAIRDLTTAISLQVGGSILLMNVDQFRAIYPEYQGASNDAIAKKLHQTFLPNLNYEDFAKDFATRRAMASTVIPDLYLKRSDAYLKKGNWHRASIEFRRATNGFPDYASAIDRWREIGPTKGGQKYRLSMMAAATRSRFGSRKFGGRVNLPVPICWCVLN
jgi:tetratricopeptide (TPR) repeat protein